MDSVSPGPERPRDSGPRTSKRSLRRLPRLLLGITAVALLILVARGALDVMVGAPIRGVSVPAGQPRPSLAQPEFSAIAAALIPLDLVDGNQIEVLSSGAGTYDRLWADLRAASSSITLQQYYCHPGVVVDTMTQLLIERRAAGVEVMLLLDGIGCRDLPDRVVADLRAAGVQLVMFRPARWYDLHRLQHRSHVRSVVIDGRVGYTGGFGLDDKWLNPAAPDAEWRDTNVRMTGPVVTQLQAAFAAGWAEATGELLAGPELFPPAAAVQEGGKTAGILYSTAGIGTTVAERFLALVIEGAAETLYIVNPYFVPDADFRRMLVEAVQRGVDVRILTAGEATDVPLTRLASRSRYQDLLDGGVRIYELDEVMIHGKSLVADRAWSSVGTLNFDNRSLRLNEELNLVSTDPATAQTLEADFRSQILQAREIIASEFRRRGWVERAAEVGARMIWFLL